MRDVLTCLCGSRPWPRSITDKHRASVYANCAQSCAQFSRAEFACRLSCQVVMREGSAEARDRWIHMVNKVFVDKDLCT